MSKHPPDRPDEPLDDGATTQPPYRRRRRYGRLSIDRIRPNPHQPRKQRDEAGLLQLAADIARHGLLQPILVGPAGPDGVHVIAAGERRWLACREAGFETIDVIIDEGLSDPDRLLELALSESIQREELSRADVAAALQRIKRQRRLSDEQLAQGYGKTVEWVRQTLAFGSRVPEGEDRLTIRPVSRRPAHRTGGRHLGGGLSDGSR